jgi:hypothetical protein
MYPLKRLSLLLVSALIGLTEGGCPGSCNCPGLGGVTFFFPAELNVQLAATGDACPPARFPVSCQQHVDGGGCTQYDVELSQSGVCLVTATAADGRQVSCPSPRSHP